MKQVVFALCTLLILIALVASCHNSAQSKAIDEAKQVQAIVEENTPGTLPTTAGGYTMTAKIDGKDWTATSMVPPEAYGRIQGYKNREYIGFAYYKRDMFVGKIITFTQDHPADLESNDHTGYWSGKKGKLEITKVDEKFAEGTFYFTASASDTEKTFEVTEGFFRIPLQDRQ